jgi:hypothetical protein
MTMTELQPGVTGRKNQSGPSTTPLLKPLLVPLSAARQMLNVGKSKFYQSGIYDRLEIVSDGGKQWATMRSLERLVDELVADTLVAKTKRRNPNPKTTAA